MLYRYLAALFLLPASFVMYGSLSAWREALGTGVHGFFSIVAKKCPTTVLRSSSMARNVFVYWPSLVGLDLLRSRSLRATGKRICRKLRRRITGASSHATLRQAPPPVPQLKLEGIRRMLREPGIRVVSFDIFDTLLVRPALEPRDILHLVAHKVDAQYGVDFIAMRYHAEAELGNPHATIHDIYRHMAKKHGLSAQAAAALMEEEIRCERTLLSPRRNVAELYAEAVRLGKRIIAVSDMYLPADVLRDILQKNNFDAIAKIYVSSEYKARKSDGTLYDVVIAEENVPPSAILHIGDNFQSDYANAIKKHIPAVHIACNLAPCFPDGAPDALLSTEYANPFWRVLLGFSYNRLLARQEERGDAALTIFNPQTLQNFTELAIAPLLTGICLSIAADPKIQHSYKQIYFASRDGYLPHKVYTVIQQYLPCLPGQYFYAGRRAYYPYLYDSFFHYVDSLKGNRDPEAYTLHDFLHAHLAGTPLLARILEDASEDELHILFFKNRTAARRVLQRFTVEIEEYMQQERNRIRRYYTGVFDPSETRHLVFDIGYSGSVGRALAAITGKAIDKLYFWEEPENQKFDARHGTTTRIFFKKKEYVPYSLLFEELFSPCEGGVIGFDAHERPRFEQTDFTAAHRADITEVHDACISFTSDFCALFGEYAPCMAKSAPDASLALTRALLTAPAHGNLRLFKNIVFPDPVYFHASLPLENKLEAHSPQQTVFTGTGFELSDNAFTSVARLRALPPRIGLHLHVHNTVLSTEVIRYLQDFPVSFDLFVTFTDEKSQGLLQRLFSKALIPSAANVTLLPVPNRGRDVAPWVLGMRPYQADYNIFCHVHTKESQHMGFGDVWRQYLFNNLLRKDAVTEIINIFTEHPHIGSLFPSIYPQVRTVMTHVGAPLYGSEHEHALICELLRRMGVGTTFSRAEIFFPVGTMLWYRPQALQQLFTCPLRLEDFPEEPIGVDGTLAHAIERIPALLATRNGYAAKTYTPFS